MPHLRCWVEVAHENGRVTLRAGLFDGIRKSREVFLIESSRRTRRKSAVAALMRRRIWRLARAEVYATVFALEGNVKRAIGVLAVVCLVVGAEARGQKPPLLAEKDVAALANETSGETAKRNLE